MLLQQCQTTTVILQSSLSLTPPTLLSVGLSIVIPLSVQAAYFLKKNKILLWDVPCTLESLQLFSDAFKVF